MDSGFSLADIKAVTDNEHNGSWGDGGSWWIILLFIVLFMNGGGGLFGGREQLATQTDMQAGFNQQTTTSKLDQIAYGLSDLGYENARLTNGAQMEMAGGFAGVQSSLAAMSAANAQCCCETKQEILTNRYDAQRNTCDIEKAIHAEGEATRSLIQSNKIEALQGKIQALELQSALCGVIRYPQSSVYTAGSWPLGGCGCGTGYYGTTF